MSELTPASRDQGRTDAEHLKLLSIFHFIGAGLAFIGILFLLGHYALFSTFMNNPKMWDGQRQSPPPVEFFAAFKWFYVVFAVWFLGSGVLNLITGFFIRARRHRIFSLVVAAINCLHMPMGTALGVFTIIVLTRDSVRHAYERPPRLKLTRLRVFFGSASETFKSSLRPSSSGKPGNLAESR